jgi:hypothetical protein
MGDGVVLELARTAFQGDTVGQSYEGNAVFNVVVVLDPAASVNEATSRPSTFAVTTRTRRAP